MTTQNTNFTNKASQGHIKIEQQQRSRHQTSATSNNKTAKFGLLCKLNILYQKNLLTVFTNALKCFC